MRRTAKALSDALVRRYGPLVEGVMVQGSVARGDIHGHSDIDMVVFLDRLAWLAKGRGRTTPPPETIRSRGWSADVDYTFLDDVLAELDRLYGSDWEMASSALGEGLILYDRGKRLRRTKKKNRYYPRAMRMRNISYLWNRIQDLSEAAGIAWEEGNYEDVSVYCRMAVERCLRIMFPIRGFKARADKRLLDEAPRMVDDELARCIQTILGTEYPTKRPREEAAEMLDALVAIMNWIVQEVRSEGLGGAIPPEHVGSEEIGQVLR